MDQNKSHKGVLAIIHSERQLKQTIAWEQGYQWGLSEYVEHNYIFGFTSAQNHSF